MLICFPSFKDFGLFAGRVRIRLLRAKVRVPIPSFSLTKRVKYEGLLEKGRAKAIKMGFKEPIKQRYLNWYLFVYTVIVTFLLGFYISLIFFIIGKGKPPNWFEVLLLIAIPLSAYYSLNKLRYILGFPKEEGHSDPITFKNIYNILVNFYITHKEDAIKHVEHKEEKGRDWVGWLNLLIFLLAILFIIFLITLFSTMNIICRILLVIILILLLILIYDTLRNFGKIELLIASRYPYTVTFDVIWSNLPSPDIYSIVFDTEEKIYYFVRYHFAVDEALEEKIKKEIESYEDIFLPNKFWIITLIQTLKGLPVILSKHLSKIKETIKRELRIK